MKTIAAVFAAFFGLAVAADTVYVDNHKGDDRNSGLVPTQPVATFKRAVTLLKPGTTLHLVNTGKSYREMLSLHNISGTPARPVVIEGNGAVLSGLTDLDPARWQPGEAGLWKIRVHKMPSNCAPFLFVAGRRLSPAAVSGTIAPMQFRWDGESFLFRPESGKTPKDYQLSASVIDSGVALMNSSYIVCRNLVSEYHANDGYNVHGNCQGLLFSQIESRFNGDDGFSVHEDVGVTVTDARFHNNMYGIQDINASRSNYYGVSITDNQVGVNFLGGLHSLVDCRITGNRTNAVLLSRGQPGIDQGKDESGAFYNGMTLIKNCYIAGGKESITITRRAQAMVLNTVITGCENGILVLPDAGLELRNSIIADCGGYELAVGGKLTADLNLYAVGKLKFGNRKFTGPADWAEYQKASGQERQSRIFRPELTADGKMTDRPASYRGGRY